MRWFSDNKDLVGIALAFVAIVVSLVTVLISRRQQQANNFLAVQELMLTPELQRGRILLYRAGITGEVPSTESADYYLMVRALAVFDLMGSYVRRGIIKRRWVLEYWHPRLQSLRPGYEAMHLDRQEAYPYRVHDRPDLLELMERAERYVCHRVCCANGRREQRARSREVAPSEAPTNLDTE